MMIRLIRSDLGVPSHVTKTDAMEQRGRAWFYRVGAVIQTDAIGAYRLVNNGDAEPADEDAERAAGDWKARRHDVLLSREMLARGIEPDDRERYRRGEILGYDEDGNDIPGPNYVEPLYDDDEEQDE